MTTTTAPSTAAFTVRQVPGSDRAALRDFVRFERELHRKSPHHVAEMEGDVLRHLSGKSAFYEQMDHAPFVASDGTRDVARCTAFVNRRFQQSKGEAVGFIGHFAAADSSPGPVRAMIARAEAWLVERGVSRIVGPYNGAAALGMGLLAAAHDEDPTFPLAWQPASYSQHFLDSGYRPTDPLWYYDVDFSSEKYRKAKPASASACPTGRRCSARSRASSAPGRCSG